jgi:hypothetical protein
MMFFVVYEYVNPFLKFTPIKNTPQKRGILKMDKNEMIME